MKWWVLRRKVHPSWLIASVCFGISIGVLCAGYAKLSIEVSVACLAVSVIIVVLSFSFRYYYLVPFLIFGGVLFGLWRGTLLTGELLAYEPLYGKIVHISGTVKDDIDAGSSDQIVIRLDNLDLGGKSLPGSLWVTSDSANIKRGDELSLHGKLSKGFGNFSGVICRAVIDKITHQSGDVALEIRDKFADAVRRVISEPESSLGIGYLVGQRRSLPTDLILALKTAGLTHIVVASGYNLTILVRLTRRLFAKISKYLSAFAALLTIAGFTAITGMSPSMSRAGLVAGLSLAAWYYGRRFHPLVLLCLAAAITLLINPAYAWGDLGWQLSFAAFAGVMILAPLLQRYLFGDKKPGFIRQILGETISAQIATAPLLIAAFGQISNVAVFPNLLILPLVPFAMLLTFIAGIGNLILPVISNLLALPAYWLLHYMVSVAEFFADLPWAVSNLRFGTIGILICYVLVISACLYMSKVTKYKLRDVNLVE